MEANFFRPRYDGAVLEDQGMINLVEFQNSHVGPFGKTLLGDGVKGPQTMWALALAEHHPARVAIVLRALSHVGTREEPMGSNRGINIDKWLARCGVPIPPPGVAAPNNAWCAAFASWCVSVEGLPEVKLALVKDLVEHFPEVGFDYVLPGDLGYEMHDKNHGHVWVVTGRQGTETMNCEGNTGNEVAVTRRRPMKYLRTVPGPMLPGIPPGVPLAGNQTR